MYLNAQLFKGKSYKVFPNLKQQPQQIKKKEN